MTYVWNTSYIDLIEKIAGIQIVLAADLKLNLFIPGSDLQDFMIDFPWSIFPTFRPIDLVMIWNSSSIWLQTRILILWDLSASSFASSVFPENEDEIWNRSGQYRNMYSSILKAIQILYFKFRDKSWSPKWCQLRTGEQQASGWRTSWRFSRAEVGHHDRGRDKLMFIVKLRPRSPLANLTYMSLNCF